MKRALVTAGVVSAVGLTGFAGAAAVSALTGADGSAHPAGSLAGVIAQKFNLKQADVQSVIDQQRSAKQAQHEQQVKDKLTQAVKAGKLTQAQADGINTKRAELQQSRAIAKANRSSQNATQRRAARQVQRTAVDQWAKANNIPASYVRLIFGGHGMEKADSAATGDDGSNDDGQSESAPVSPLSNN